MYRRKWQFMFEKPHGENARLMLYVRLKWFHEICWKMKRLRYLFFIFRKNVCFFYSSSNATKWPSFNWLLSNRRRCNHSHDCFVELLFFFLPFFCFFFAQTHTRLNDERRRRRNKNVERLIALSVPKESRFSLLHF